MVLPVIEVQADFPVLNAESSRIAPLLIDDPRAEIVRTEPDSGEAQDVVAELVLKSHRKLDGLSASLANSQTTPGVITRTGKLLNANTRCVVLRQLIDEGKVAASRRLRVMVLPADFTPNEEVQLENVLQKQQEHKDEYNFVAELDLLRRLHVGGMTPQAIAKQQELGRGGPKLVKDLLDIYDLMEYARRLVDPPIPFALFVADDQRQNWLDLLRQVRKLRDDGDTAGADDALRGFILANFVGAGAVHKTRLIDDKWIGGDLYDALKSSDSPLATDLVAHVEAKATEQEVEATADPEGVDLLGDEDAPAASPVADALLEIAAKAKAAGAGDVTLADGKVVPAPDLLATIESSTNKTLDARKREEEAGRGLDKPGNLLAKAVNYVQDANAALKEVMDEPDFGAKRDRIQDLVEDLELAVDELHRLAGDDVAEE